MKSTILICCLLSLSASIAQPRLEWERRYQGQEQGTVNVHCSTADGGFALACEAGVNENADLLLRKVNADGELEWAQRFGRENEGEWPRGVVQCEDGGFLVACTGVERNLDLLAVRFDADGEVVRSNYYGRDQVEQCDGLTRGIDGGFVIVGMTNSFGNALDGYAIKLNEDGELEWERNYNFGGQYDMFTGIVAVENGYVLCGSGSGNRRPMLAEIDAEGELEWSRFYDHDDGFLRTIWDMDFTLDGGFILAGHANLRPGGDAVLIRTDSEGGLIWSRRYDSGRGERGSSTYGRSVATLPNGDFVLCGQTDGSDFWTIWVDSEGEPYAQDYRQGYAWTILSNEQNEVFVAGDDGNSPLMLKYSLQEPFGGLQLTANWDIYSSHVIPAETDIPTLFSPVVERENLILIKDQSGRFYLPEHNFSNLPDWDVHRGYMIKMARADSLEIEGEPVPIDEPISLSQGWNIIAYFPDEDLEAPIAFESIENVLIMAKDGRGHFYLPEQDFNNLPSLHRGAGYLVKVREECELRWEER